MRPTKRIDPCQTSERCQIGLFSVRRATGDHPTCRAPCPDCEPGRERKYPGARCRDFEDHAVGVCGHEVALYRVSSGQRHQTRSPHNPTNRRNDAAL
jgi:hypothetical protein